MPFSTFLLHAGAKLNINNKSCLLHRISETLTSLAWSLSPNRAALAAHIIMDDQMLSWINGLAARVRDLLWRHVLIEQSPWQFEARPEEGASNQEDFFNDHEPC